jgi:hypothetical protein
VDKVDLVDAGAPQWTDARHRPEVRSADRIGLADNGLLVIIRSEEEDDHPPTEIYFQRIKVFGHLRRDHLLCPS